MPRPGFKRRRSRFAAILASAPCGGSGALQSVTKDSPALVDSCASLFACCSSPAGCARPRRSRNRRSRRRRSSSSAIRSRPAMASRRARCWVDAARRQARDGALSASRRERIDHRRHDGRWPRALAGVAEGASAGGRRDRARRQRRVARRSARGDARQSRCDGRGGAGGRREGADRRHEAAAELRLALRRAHSTRCSPRSRRRARRAFVPYLFEGFGEDFALFQPDRIHPTAEAQPKMLATVWPALRTLLGPPAR